MDSEIQERAAGAFGSRWAMGAIALVLVLISVVVLGEAAAEDAECEASGGGFCSGTTELAFWLLALPLWVIATLVALGAFLPSGTLRRVVISLGVGLLTAMVLLYGHAAAVIMMGAPAGLFFVVGWIAALAGFCVAFGIAYRLTN